MLGLRPQLRAAALALVPSVLLGCLASPGEPTQMRPVVIPPPPPPLVCTDPATNSGVTPPRLLTRFEFDNSVRDLLSLTSTDTLKPSVGFPAENRVLGFDNNASSHVVNPLLVSNCIDAAERISQHVVDTGLSRVVPCNPELVGTSTCGAAFIDRILPRAFRRSPKPEERTAIRHFFDTAAGAEGFQTAVAMTLQLILQSPQFLYRLEPGNTGQRGVRVVPLDDDALASRLSYFLWASIPDDELREAAGRGDLQRSSALYEAQVRRMMSDPKARRTTEHFHRLWLEVERLDTLVKDTRVYPEWNEALRASWTGSINAFVDDAVWGDPGTLEAFLTEPAVWVDSRLAQLYGVSPPTNGGFKKVQMLTSHAGVLTQPALMAALALPNQTSPIKRGVFIRERILCQNLPAPPANMAIVPPDPKPGATTRERFVEHTANEFCASCHQRIDPVGFGLEAFDAMGRYRSMEQGKVVDASGHLGFMRDTALEGDFNGAQALAAKLLASPEVSDCVAREWFRYAIGRDATSEDTCSLVNVQTTFSQSGGKFRELILALTQTDAFRYRVVDEEAP